MKKPKVVIYDNDGMVTHGGRVSEKYAQEFGIDGAVIAPFFGDPLKKCQIGKADLKVELAQVLQIWGWKGTVEELMAYWFAIGDELNTDVYASIAALKAQGLITCLATNNEKYRLEYLIRKHSYHNVFDEIFSSAELGAYKHSQEGLEKILRSLNDKYGSIDKGEIMYWDDREGNVENLNKLGFNGQQYTNYKSFKAVMESYGYPL